MKKDIIETSQNAPQLMGDAERLIAQAIDKQVPVETMERLLAMRRELKAERAKEEYDQAMAQFQAECPTIQKTREVHTKSGALAYRYAPIESIVEQIKEALRNNRFSYSTNMELLPNGVKVSVKVVHGAGHSETTDMSVPFGTQTQIMSQTQVVAAATTFAKRYAFCNAFGILTGDEDTDARTSQPETPRAFSERVHSQEEEKVHEKIHLPITNDQKLTIISLMGKKGKKMEEIDKAIENTEKFIKPDGTHAQTYKDLSHAQAVSFIAGLSKQPDFVDEEEIDLDQVDDALSASREQIQK